MDTQYVDLRRLRPAELWRLIHPQLAYEEEMLRDTLLFLLAARVLKLSVEKKVPDGTISSPMQYVYIEQGEAFDSFTPREYESRIIDFFMRAVGHEVLLRSFIIDFLKKDRHSEMKRGVISELSGKGLVASASFARFTLPAAGKKIREYGGEMISTANNIGEDLREDRDIAIDYVQDLLRNLGYHLILLDDFPFRSLKSNAHSYAEMIGFEGSFFAEDTPDLPDLQILLNISAFDNVFNSATKPRGRIFGGPIDEAWY